MSTNSLEQLKKAKSTLQAERKPVSQVQEAVKETKKITQFVNGALSKENRWIFQAGEQESIVSMLADITRTIRIFIINAAHQTISIEMQIDF